MLLRSYGPIYTSLIENQSLQLGDMMVYRYLIGWEKTLDKAECQGILVSLDGFPEFCLISLIHSGENNEL
jgi:hypothetical protein